MRVAKRLVSPDASSQTAPLPFVGSKKRHDRNTARQTNNSWNHTSGRKDGVDVFFTLPAPIIESTNVADEMISLQSMSHKISTARHWHPPTQQKRSLQHKVQEVIYSKPEHSFIATSN